MTTYTKQSIFEIRKGFDTQMQKYTDALRPFLESHNFYPGVFYNENDINHPIYGIRPVIPNLNNYSGIFINQDAPDTPIAGFNGVEFRTSLTKSIAKTCKQLLWTYQDLTHLTPLPPSDYDPTPSVGFCGTIVFMENGQIFPQQTARFHSVIELALSGVKVQNNVIRQQFVKGTFTDVAGHTLPYDEYQSFIASHPYGLSVRGWGNWDYRFYELMALGRIPVHIHTDDELLFEREIPWDDYIVVLKQGDDIKQRIDDFHGQFTDNRSLHAHQRKLVKLYHDKLNFPKFVEHFEEYYEDELDKWL